MKKTIVLIMIAILSMQLIACGNKDAEVSIQSDSSVTNQVKEDEEIETQVIAETSEEEIVEDKVKEIEDTAPEETEVVDMPDIIDGDATEDGFSEDEVLNAFQATYRTEDVGEVVITKTDENKYTVNFGLYGKGLFEDTNAYYENYAIHFNFLTPTNGTVSGYMEFGETMDILNVVILQSDWPQVPEGTFVEIEKRIEF